ncbi:mitochondrial sodium/calcium exchanger protein-like [Physella acuta]|uniref:mitochondrial sodium/calcium exchanger protein-like n=1 Tax=Physella acuta TaxID=109671 RepID=UPI0027DB9AF6|nr:mitochondrial sodium/calcium exchanger protein-like [Physella acuta]
MSDSDLDCNQLHHIPNLTDVCGFVKSTDSCQIDEGFVNYIQFLYCTLSAIPVWAACIVIGIWWLFLFCGLATTADEFFCPSLAVISQSLKLSHNVAGVTFLAFGNGAPDIFSAIAAIGNAKSGDAGMAVGALFGAGVFVTAVVAGSIAIIHPFHCMHRPFLRDVIFYLAACFWVWCVLWKKQITQLEAAGFIILYVVYVLVVIVGRYINQKIKNKRQGFFSETDTGIQGEADVRQPLLPPSVGGGPEVEIEAPPLEMTHRPSYHTKHMLTDFMYEVNPIDVSSWHEKKLLGKIYEIFKSPLVLVLKLTIPVVDEAREMSSPEERREERREDDLRNWNKLLNSLHVFTGPVFTAFATGVGLMRLGNVFPVYALVMIITSILAVIVFFTSDRDKRPIYHTGFAYLGFFVAVVWIYSIANEIVNILQALGVAIDLSDAILGLTLLAWGNSIGDFVADTTMARQGFPRMGISACFGGPLFNMLLGLGIPFSIACFKNRGTFDLKVNLEQMTLAAGLGFSLVSSFIIVPLFGFKMSRPYGIYLLVLYAAFLVIAILIEVNVIQNFDL